MRKVLRTLVAIVVCLSPLSATAEVVDQIGIYTEVDYIGTNSSALSMLDTGSNNFGQLGLAYDNFTFVNSGAITSVSWVGIYAGDSLDDPLLTNPPSISPDFTISFYNTTPTTYPTASFASFSIPSALVTTSLIATAPTPYTYLYTASLPGLSVTGGVEYWVSVSADFDFNLNEWGLAFSNLGNPAQFGSYQMFDDGVNGPVTNFDPVNYAISLTAIPEPGAAALVAIAVGLLGFRRRRVS